MLNRINRQQMEKVKYYLGIILFVLGASVQAQTIDLSGEWKIALDSTDRGEREEWYKKEFAQTVSLPGTTDGAGLGTPNSLAPALEKPQLLRLTRKHAYIGAAWYAREVEIPESMAGKPLVFSFERVMWRSELWVDGVKRPQVEESLTTPHCFEMPEGLSAGKHSLVLRIDNRKLYDISENNLAHAYTNDTQIMWNGVLGKMILKVLPEVYVKQVDVYPDVERKRIRVVAGLENTSGKQKRAKLVFRIKDNVSGTEKRMPEMNVLVPDGRKQIEAEYAMGEDVALWDEFSPVVYTLIAGVRTHGQKAVQENEVSFGMREVSADGNHLTVNGNRVFLRGTLECCVFPLTGTPPVTEEGWMKEFAAAKDWGLNHLRFHSWCPPEAAFRAADKMGLYLQVELPNWSLSVGKDKETVRFLYSEFDRIVRSYGNHPSFCLLTAGNELQPDFGLLNEMVAYMKEKDSRHLYATTSFTFEKGHGARPEPQDQFFITQWTDRGWVRGQGVFDQDFPCFDKDYRQAAKDIRVPLISHEIGQYAVYPDMKEIARYTGVLDPLNFKAVKKDLGKKGLFEKAGQYLEASGKLAVKLYKEEIERAMKTPQFSGFQLLGLSDFSGQGTALVGLLNSFWESKGLTDSRTFRQFCAPLVLLSRFEKAVYSGSESFSAWVEIANYSNAGVRKSVSWSLKDKNGVALFEGKLPAVTASKGTVTSAGSVCVALNKVSEASRLTFEVEMEGTEWKNSWNIWVYPELDSLDSGEVVVTQDVDKALASLEEGCKVLFSPSYKCVKGLEGKFVPVFWSPVHFPKQAGTMGLLCDPSHPALRFFPADMHTDWQWWRLVKNSRVVVLDSLRSVTPIIESVDNFTNNRRLASVFEARCGKGSLMVSTMDLLSDGIADKPEVKQLLYSLLRYMNSSEFHPAGKPVTAEELRSLLLPQGKEEVQQTDATSIYN